MTKPTFKRNVTVVYVLFTVLCLFVFYGIAKADILENRTLQISSSFPSEIVTHTFGFSTVTDTNIGSIEFEYCTNDPFIATACSAPAGLDVSSSVISSQTGVAGFTVSGSTTANKLIISRAPAFETAVAVEYALGNITNPSTPDEIVYVRISVFDNVDGSGVRVDKGAVVFVVDDRFNVSAQVPPYMTFCVAVTVAVDCSSTTGTTSDFGEFSKTQVKTASTQFAVSTNDPTGYNTFVNGPSMTSGVAVIPTISILSASTPGVSQFGLNLRGNVDPLVGADVSGAGVGQPDADYNIVDMFKYVAGEKIAGATQSTEFNRYTVSYIVNISNTQSPGVYSTTLTFTSIASF